MAQVELERKFQITSSKDVREVVNSLHTEEEEEERKLTAIDSRLGLRNSPSKTDVPTDYDTDSAITGQGELDAGSKECSSRDTSEGRSKYSSINDDFSEEIADEIPSSRRVEPSWAPQKPRLSRRNSERQPKDQQQHRTAAEMRRTRGEQQVAAGLRRELVRATRDIGRLETMLQRKEAELNRLKESQAAATGASAEAIAVKKSVSERERILLRKSASLSAHVTRLEKQCKTLRLENDRLRKQMEASRERPRDAREKGREDKLARKNAELLSATRRLQDKVRILQKEVNKQPRLEKTIQSLRKELKQAKERHGLKLSQSQSPCLQAELGSSDQELLRLAARERLKLERQIDALAQELQRETAKFLHLQGSNHALQNEYETLKGSFNHVEDLLEEKRQHCEDLRKKLSEKSEFCSDLETQLHCALSKNTELAILNSDLEKQLQEIKNVNDSSCELQTTLGFIDTNRPLANLELEGLQVKVDGLDMVLRQMHEATEKKKELEQEKREVLQQLQQLQDELKKLDKTQDSERGAKLEIVENLQSKLRELEKKCELQNVRHEELILEMAAIKRSQAKTSDWSGSPQPINQEVQTSPDNGLPLHSSQLNANFTPSVMKDVVSCVENIHSSVVSTVDNHSNLLYSSAGLVSGINTSVIMPTIGTTTSSMITINSTTKNPTYLSSNYSHLSSTLSPSNPMYARSVSPLPGLRSSSPAPSFGRSTSPLPTGTSAQIDRIMAKIEQDNKILAELDRTRATIGLSSSIFSNTAVANLYGSKSYSSMIDSSPYPLYPTPLGTESSVTQAVGIAATTVHSVTTSAIPTIITTTCEAGNVANANTALTPAVGSSSAIIENDNPMDYLEIPGRGRVQVFIARYSYDPLQHSPNENPEAELAVNAGDYIYVVGGMDEDGFYDGELMSGKRGLVPSNFVERLRGEDLLEFQRSILLGIRDADEENLVGGQDANFVASNDSQLLIEEYRKAIDQSYLELWDMEDEEDELHAAEHSQEGDTFFSVLVPAPQKLTLERQLHKSILISWSPPDAPEKGIESYVVYVDGLLKMTVKASDRTRALVEGVDSSMPHRISVRSVTPNKRTSRDAACTMVIGRDVPIAPSCVRATNVTATSAIISWLPSNSNYQHSVCVNNVEVRVVKPGVYRHTISGLTPNTTYRVSVRVKNIKIPMAEDKPAKKLEMISSFVDFKTLQVGLPDPPLDIQVEAGPQDGTLLITWLPVTINESGTSNGAPVTGYAVYADGKKVIDIDSPTGDHALLNIAHLQGVLPKAVTVRTKSHDSLSPDSMLTKVPPDLIKGSRMKHKTASLCASDESDSDPELIELLTHIGSNSVEPIEFTIYGLQKNVIEDLERSSDGSELSDIAEEAEDDLSDAEEGKESMKDDRDRGRDQNREHRDHRPSPRGSEPKESHEKIASRRSEGNRGRDDRGLDRGRDQRPMQPSRGPRDYPMGDPRGGRDLRSPRGPYEEKIIHGHVDPRRRDVPRSHRHYNSHGQIIIEPEENLSDKEIYPPSHMTIPSIEITKDSASEGRNSVDVCSDEEYEIGRNGMHTSGKHGVYPDYGRDKTRSSQAGDRSQSTREREYYDREWNHRRAADSYAHDYSSRRKGVTHDETQRPRLFRAIFDYDPRTMSPNPNAADEELPFREGQIIKIFGEMDPDGFYWGEANNKKGYVPGNMVTELPMDQNAVDQRHSTSNRRSGDRWGESYVNLPKRKMVALYDYDPQELSPNVDAEAELSFSTGDVIYVYGEMDEDGFYLGELNGLRGLVPSNFLMEAPADYRETPRREALLPHDASSSGGKVSRESRDRERRKAPAEDGQYGKGRGGAQRW